MFTFWFSWVELAAVISRRIIASVAIAPVQLAKSLAGTPSAVVLTISSLMLMSPCCQGVSGSREQHKVLSVKVSVSDCGDVRRSHDLTDRQPVCSLCVAARTANGQRWPSF